jgi:hypothetical protein
VAVEQTPASIDVTPATATVGKGDAQLFAASALDQFGAVLATQPEFAWNTSGGGSITADGTFTANTVGGPFTITATSGVLVGNASVTVTGELLTHWRNAHFTPAEITAGIAADLFDADNDGLVNLIEYGIGTDPRSTTSPLTAAMDATGHLTLTLTRPKSLPDALYIGEATSDPTTWPTTIPVEIITDGDPQTIRITDPLGTLDSAQRFLRLRISTP